MRVLTLLAVLMLVCMACHSQVYRSYTFGSATGQIRNNFNLKTDVNSSVVFIYGNNKFEIKKVDLNGTEVFKHTYYVYSDSLFNLCLPVSSYSKFYPHRSYFDHIDSTYYLGGIIKANYSPCFDDYNALIKFSTVGDTLWILHVGPANDNFDFIKFNDSTLILLNGGMVSYNLLTKSVNWYGSLWHPNIWFANPKMALKNTDSTIFYSGYYRPAPISIKGVGMFGKMNLNGNPIWAKLYSADTSNAYNFNKMCRDLDSKYYMLTEVYDSVNANVLTNVTCLNDTGMVLWSKYYYVPNFITKPVDIIEKSNGGCMVLCDYRMNGQQAICPITINLDSMGNVISAYKQYSMIPGVDGIGYSIQKASENTYAIDGPKLVVLDSSGWSCDASSITVLDSANYFTVSNIAFQLDSLTLNVNNINVFYVINNSPDSVHVDTCIYYAGINNLQLQKSSVQVFPQPASNEINISCSSNFNTIKIFDAFGRVVRQINLPVRTNQSKLNLNLFSSGIYFFTLSLSGNQVVNGKFIVCKE